MKNICIGVLFAMLWASASVATKFGVLSVPPLFLGNVRFFIAGLVLLMYAYLTKKTTTNRRPTKEEWKQL